MSDLPAPYFANVNRPAPRRLLSLRGRRTIARATRSAVLSVAFRGIIHDPAGHRVPVEACASHSPDLIELRPLI